MRLLLPHIATTDPEGLLDALQGRGDLLTGHETGRLASLQSCVGYSFEHLAPEARRLLTAVSLFHGVVDVNVLALLSMVEEVPARFAGIDRDGWAGALEAAASVGLLTSIGAGMFRIHPALPAYLAALWHHDEHDRYDAQHAHASHALLTAYAAFGGWLYKEMQTGDAGLALSIVELQRRTIGYLLGTAIEYELWHEAQAIAQPLDEYFTSRGLDEEARGWVDRVRLATENADGTAPDLGTPAAALWLLFVESQADREQRRGRLANAERTHLEIQAALNAQPPSPEQRYRLATASHHLGRVAQDRGRLDDAEASYRQALTIYGDLGDRRGMAGSYHHLGRVAQDRGRLDDAEASYRQALTIDEELGNRRGMAASYHHLGILAQLRGRPDDAETWYRQALTINEELRHRHDMATIHHHLGTVAQDRGRLDDAETSYRQALTINEDLRDFPGMATTYHQLGILAHHRERLDDAEAWYRQALTIKEKLSNRPGMAASYHHLGILAQDRGRLDDAETWYRQALTINEDLDNRAAMAASYHHLGILAQDRGRLDDAEAWYRQALTIKEKLSNRPGMALTYHQLGLLAATRGQDAIALEWTVRGVALFDEFQHPARRPGADHLARLTRKLGLGAVEACWRKVTGVPLPQATRNHISSSTPDDQDEG